MDIRKGINFIYFFLIIKKLDDYELARVSGRIHFPTDSTTPSLDVDTTDEQPPKAPSVFVGDIRLSEFKKVLQQEGISAEFKGEGVLVCNDCVAVRKVKEKKSRRRKRLFGLKIDKG